MWEWITSIVYRKSALYRLAYLAGILLLVTGVVGSYLARPYLKLPVGMVSDAGKQIRVELPFARIKDRIMQEERARASAEAVRTQQSAVEESLQRETQRRLQQMLVAGFGKGTPVYRLSDRLRLAGYVALAPQMEGQSVVYTLHILDDAGSGLSREAGQPAFEFRVASPSVLVALRNLFYHKEHEIRQKAKIFHDNINVQFDELCKQLNSECQERAGLPVTICKDRLQSILLQTVLDSVDWKNVIGEIGGHQKTEELRRLFTDNVSVSSLVAASLKGLVTRLAPMQGVQGDIERQLKNIVQENQQQIVSHLWQIGEHGARSAQLEIERAWLQLGSKDFADVNAFLALIRKPAEHDKVAAYLRQRLLADEQATSVDGWSAERMLQGLNRLCAGPLYYRQTNDGTAPVVAEPFRQIELSEETRKAAPTDFTARGNDLVRFHRLVLQDCYPTHLKPLALLTRLSCLFSLADNPVLRNYVISQVPMPEQEATWRKFQKILYEPSPQLVQPITRMQDNVKEFAIAWIEALLLNNDKSGPNPLLLLAIKESFAGRRPLVICNLSSSEIDDCRKQGQRFTAVYKD